MQKIIYTILTMTMLTMISVKALSQETANEKSKVYSSIIADCDSVKPPTFKYKVAMARRDSVYLRAVKVKMDTIHPRLFGTSKKMDSLHRIRPINPRPKMSFSYKTYDSVRMVNGKDTFYTYKSYSVNDSGYKRPMFDTLNKRMALAQHKRLDTLRRLNEMRTSLFRSSKKMDTLYRMNGMRTTLFVTSKKMDSLARMRSDSVRVLYKMKQMNQKLERMKWEMKKNNLDSIRKNIQPKEITIQLSCDNNAVVAITNLSQKINIKTSVDNKVRLSTVIDASEDGQLSDVASFKKIGIKLEGSGAHIDIKNTSAPVTITATASSPASITLKTSYSKSVDPISKMDINKSVTIFIPEKAKLEIEAIANVHIDNDLTSLSAVVSNADLVMKNADKVVIRSSYGLVKAGTIGNADIALMNCRFICGNIDRLKINSKYSNVQFLNSGNTALQSDNDQYKIQEVGDLSGNKSFGAIAVANIKKSFVLTASSADVKIKNIESAADLIKIVNKYAELQLPASQLKNYSVAYSGSNSRFNDFFSKDTLTQPKFDYAPKYSITSTADFSKEVGDTKADHTKFQISCSNCFVGFN